MGLRSHNYLVFSVFIKTIPFGFCVVETKWFRTVVTLAWFISTHPRLVIIYINCIWCNNHQSKLVKLIIKINVLYRNRSQCDQIVLFLKDFLTNFLIKVSFWKLTLQSKNCNGFILDNFWGKMAAFNTNIWSHWWKLYLIELLLSQSLIGRCLGRKCFRKLEMASMVIKLL